MTIPEIKSRLAITTVLQHYNYKPTATGSMSCPFHGPGKGKAKKKTLQIYLDTNRYQCFHKDCKAVNGDVIDFIELQEGFTKHEAIEKAKSLVDSSYSSNAPSDGNVQETKEAHSDGSHRPGESKQVPGSGGHFEVRSPEQMHYQDEILEITVLGGIRIEGLDRMRCTLKLSAVAYPSIPSLRHTLDLYHDDHLQKLIRKTAERLEIGTSKITAALNSLTDHLEQYRLNELEKQQTDQSPKVTPLTEKERSEALSFLKAPNLMAKTNELLGESGIVGEEKNRQTLWLVYSSRKREKPLHVICLGASGTGKTYLQEMVARLIPDNEKFTFTAGTENAFYYLEPYDLCHKVVLIEDMDGVQYLLYPLRELQTKSWISKIVPIKDAKGDIKTKNLEVYGPICLSGTTTKERLYEDNSNRCLLLHLDNSPAQEEAIMDYQRAVSARQINWQREQAATQLLQNIQSVLKPMKVINPYALQLKIPRQCFKPLRTNQHYLQFIETVTWYHQCQREEQVDKETGEVYIETTLEDIEITNQLMKDTLLTKSDELPRAIRTFFESVKEWLASNNEKSFYSKALRNHFRMYPMKANRYIKTLEQYGYLKKSGGNKKQGYEYEVADWQEYDSLKAEINILDQLLETLKKEATS